MRVVSTFVQSLEKFTLHNAPFRFSFEIGVFFCLNGKGFDSREGGEISFGEHGWEVFEAMGRVFI
jgi:hypothetical protein